MTKDQKERIMDLLTEIKDQEGYDCFLLATTVKKSELMTLDAFSTIGKGQVNQMIAAMLVQDNRLAEVVQLIEMNIEDDEEAVRAIKSDLGL